MTTETAEAETFRDRWHKAWPVILVSIGYMLPLFWLWSQTGYPDDLGLHIAAHDKAGLVENWWYSYLLLRRHHVLDVMTFAYMWAAVVSIFVWISRAAIKDRLAKQMNEISDAETKKGDTV